jgi:hypothetical protein
MLPSRVFLAILMTLPIWLADPAMAQRRQVSSGCYPENTFFRNWSIENNPVVPVRYKVRGGVDRCNHQLWDSINQNVTSVKIIRQPKFGRVSYNSSFRSIDYFSRDKNTMPDNLAVQVCSKIDGKAGCLTLEYSYTFEPH